MLLADYAWNGTKDIQLENLINLPPQDLYCILTLDLIRNCCYLGVPMKTMENHQYDLFYMQLVNSSELEVFYNLGTKEPIGIFGHHEQPIFHMFLINGIWGKTAISENAYMEAPLETNLMKEVVENT